MSYQLLGDLGNGITSVRLDWATKQITSHAKLRIEPLS